MSAPSDIAAQVTPLSRAQIESWDARQQPATEQVADGVWAIPVPIPAGTIPHTLCYALLGDDGVHLIDPGWDHPDSVAALAAGLAVIGHELEDVRTVIATHFHPDHLGAAELLRVRFGARVVFSATETRVLRQETSPAASDIAAYREQLDGWGVPAKRWEDLLGSFDRATHVSTSDPDIAAEDGGLLELPGHRLRIVGTPGHTDGHICLVDDERRILYTGDHVLPRIYPGIGIGMLPGSDPLGDYFESLDRLAPYDEYHVLPGHEFQFLGLAVRRTQLIEHHLRRSAEVAALRDRLGDASIWEYARRLTWTSGWEHLTGFWLHSALRQTALHLDYVASGRADVRLAGYLAARD